MNGSSFFTDNQGSVFGVVNTKIVLEGILYFSNNFAGPYPENLKGGCTSFRPVTQYMYMY